MRPDMKLQHFNSLDGLRAVAVLFVLVVHLPSTASSQTISIITALGSASKLGYLGVDIFFVLSGFLITRIIHNEHLAGTFSFKNFYMRRSLRIFPVYFLAIAICALIFNFDGIPYFLLFSGNYFFAFNTGPNPLTHTWSLAVEEQFYILWPAVIIFFYGLQRRKFVIVGFIIFAVVSSVVIEMTLESGLAHRLVQFSLTSRMLSLCLGGYIALYPKDEKLGKLVLIMFAGLLIAYTSIYFRTRLQWLPLSTSLMVGFSITSAMIVNIFLYFEKNKNQIFNYLFKNKFITYIGKISYGVYVYHYIIFYIYKINIREFASSQYVEIIYLLLLAMIFAVSAISFQFFERPLLRLKNRYYSSNSQTRQTG